MRLNNRAAKSIGFAALAFLLVPAVSADVWDKKTSVTFREPVEFPGGTVLAPGNYVLKLLPSAADRHVVQVYNQDEDGMYAMVTAIAAQRSTPAEKTIITFYETPKERPALIRTWFYPGDSVGQEFTYPNDRANHWVRAPAFTSPLETAPKLRAGQSVRNSTRTHSDPEVSEVPAEEPVLLARSTRQLGVFQTPRAGAAVGDATAPSAPLPLTATNAPYLAAGSLVLLASAFLIRTARQVRG